MNAFFNFEPNQEFIQGLHDTITVSTIETFDQIFGHKLSFSAGNSVYETDIITANAEFWEGFETFSIFFIFEKTMLLSLMGSIYNDKTLTPDKIDELCKDMVCELVNIIGNKIKVFINQHGLRSSMEIPTADITAMIDPAQMHHTVHANFCSSDIDNKKNVIYVGSKDIA